MVLKGNKNLATLVLASSLTTLPLASASACGAENSSSWAKNFYELVEGHVSNPQVIDTDADGVIYIPFDTELHWINKMNAHPGEVDRRYKLSTTQGGKQPVFQTVDQIFAHLEPSNRYMVGINVNSGSREYGQAIEVYNARTGQELKAYAAFKCMDSPRRFVE